MPKTDLIPYNSEVFTHQISGLNSLAVRLLRLLLPSGLLLVASFVLTPQLTQNQTFQPILTLLPWLLGPLALALGYGFNRSRAVLSALNLCAAYALIQSCLQASLDAPANYVLFVLLSLWLPACQALICLFNERGLLTPAGLMRITFCLSGYLAMALLWQQGTLAYWLPQLPSAFIEFIQAGYYLSYGSSWVALGSLLISMLVFILRRTPLDAALFITLISALLMLHSFNKPMISSLMISTALIMLMLAVVQSSYQMAFLDELTGIPARRALKDKMLTLGRRYSLAMMDVDHFKKFNDTYGHDIGDQVLRMVAAKINQVGGGGRAYRYGGEEFTIVFPGKTEAQALPYLEEVRETIANYPMRIRSNNRPENDKQGQTKRGRHADTEVVSVAISIGVCEKRSNHADAEAVMKAADEALYAAKRAGRNRTMAAHTRVESEPPQNNKNRARKDFV